MKTSQSGFIVPLLIIIIAALAIGGGVYIHSRNNKICCRPVTPLKNFDESSPKSNVSDDSSVNGMVNLSASTTINSSVTKASGIIKSVYSKNGKYYLDIDYVTMNQNFKPGGRDGSPYTNDNPQIRTFEVSGKVTIHLTASTPSSHEEDVNFHIFSSLFNSNDSILHNLGSYNPWDIEIQNNLVTRMTEHYLP